MIFRCHRSLASKYNRAAMAGTLMKYINLFGGVAFGGTSFVIGLSELYTNETLPAAPDSLILITLILASFALVLTSVIGAIGELQSGEDTVSKRLLQQTMGFHHRISGRLIMLTALFAGISLKSKDHECGDDENEACLTLFSGTWSLGEGLFLGALIYKSLDAVVDFLSTLLAGDTGYKPLTNKSVAEKKARDFVGFTALLIAQIFVMVNHGIDEVFNGYKTTDGKTAVPTFKNTSYAEEEGKVDKPLLNWAMILSWIVLAVVLVVVGLIRTENYILSAFGSLSSAISHVISGLLSVHVGKYLHVLAYETADGDFLPSNFFYFGAAILAAYAAIHFDAKDVIEDDEDKTAAKGTVREASLFAIAAGSFALWAAQTLYANVSYEDDVKAPFNGAMVDVKGPRVSKARELGMYVMILLVFLTFQGFAVKLFETVIKTGGSFAGLFKGVKSDDSDRFSTLRAEMTLVFALTSAVLWGSKVKQGDAAALKDGTLVSLWILWTVAAGGRAISFINVLAENEITTLGQLLVNDKIKRIFADDDDNTQVTIPCLGAVISLVLSFVSYTVYVFHGSDKDGYEFFGDEYVRFFQALSFILVAVHVLLTILGTIPGVTIGKAKALHAGYSPIVRFGVSSIALWSFGMAAGQEILSKANEQYALPALLLYMAYDILSKGKF